MVRTGPEWKELPVSLSPEGVVSNETVSSLRYFSFLPVGSGSVHYGFLVFRSRVYSKCVGGLGLGGGVN